MNLNTQQTHIQTQQSNRQKQDVGGRRSLPYTNNLMTEPYNIEKISDSTQKVQDMTANL